MNKQRMIALVRHFGPSVLLCLLGLLLALNPDSASGFIGTVLGWCLTAAGIVVILSALGVPGGQVGKILAGLVCVAAGVWMLRNPLALVRSLGRFVGILLTIRGVQELLASRTGGGKGLSAALTVVGLVLVLLPMTTSRLVFSLCGLVVLAMGIVSFAQRLKQWRGDSGDGNIIDAL